MTHKNRRRGFTLVELLTVIGIIILLIGILIPVLRAVRGSAFGADSQAAIMNLANAIERYRQDFGAYPGVIPNSAFATADGRATAYGNMTMSENLLLSLAGGWEPGNTLNVNMIGSGPMSHNPTPSARQRKSAYFDITPGVTVQAKPWDQPVIQIGVHGYASIDRTDIPEFIDKFPDAMPILYLRARAGGTGVTDPPTAGAQYQVNHLLPYIRPDVPPATTRTPFPANTRFPGSSEDLNNDGNLDEGEDLNGNGSLDRDFASAEAYFTNPSIPGVARQKDGFILIGAGQDRKYGTRDDQTNFGPLQ